MSEIISYIEPTEIEILEANEANERICRELGLISDEEPNQPENIEFKKMTKEDMAEFIWDHEPDYEISSDCSEDSFEDHKVQWNENWICEVFDAIRKLDDEDPNKKKLKSYVNKWFKIETRGRPSKPKAPKEPKPPRILKTANRQEYNKEYNKKYYTEKRQDITICDVCGGKYEKYNKKNHELTNRHIFIYNKINNII